MKKLFRHGLFTRIVLPVFFLLIIFCFHGAVHAEETDETMPDNGIPVVYVNVDESQGTIEDMLSSPDHSVYCYGTVSIEVPEGFHYADLPDIDQASVHDLAMSIRGRGNSTWERKDKKPFKIKLDKKTDLFGFGKNKHWVLVANAMDPSLLRDRITAWLGDALGFEFTPRGVPVDLVMRGEQYGTKYLGAYYLSENVRVDTNRLEIDELEEDDVDEPTITGGYLLQDALQVRQGSPDRFFTSRHVDWATHTPSFDTEAEAALGASEGEEENGEENFAAAELGDAYENHVQQTYIQNHIQEVEDALFAGTADYRELMDLETAAKYWLVNDFSLNADSYGTGSTYIYKKRDVDGVVGKIYWGPLWDFDFSWDNRPVTSGFTVRHEWLKPLFCDRSEGGFVEEIRKQWPSFREKIVMLVEDGGLIDQYAAETEASAIRDDEINHAGEYEQTYLERVENLKNWIKDRLAWVDANLDMIDGLAHRVEFMSDDSLYALAFKAHSETIEDIADICDPPEKEGYVFTGWADEDGNLIEDEFIVDREMVLTAQFISESEAVHAQDITFRKDSDVTVFGFWSRMYEIQYEIIPADAQEKKVTWTSSDESFATVDPYGVVSFNGPGTVTITATLANGVSRDFTLTVTDADLPIPDEVIPEQEVYEMEPGQMLPVIVETEPTPARISNYQYVSDDENVVTVDAFGVLCAVGPGETTVRIITTSPDGTPEGKVIETIVTVIVSEETPEPTPEPAEITYTVTNGADGSWTKGSSKDFTLTIKRSEADETCFAHFTSVKIDGKLIGKDKDYTAAPGSTVITIKASMLETLKDGSHTVSVIFDDGTAETTLKIAPKGVTPAPDTSDHENTGWAFLMAGALLASALALILRVKTAR